MVDGLTDSSTACDRRDDHSSFYTNNSMFTPTSCATDSPRWVSTSRRRTRSSFGPRPSPHAQFVRAQRPGGSAFVIGEDSLHSALHDAGYREATHETDYVILGETQDHSFEDFATAIGLIEKGSRFAPQPGNHRPSPTARSPGCGAMAAIIERATGVAPTSWASPNARCSQGAGHPRRGLQDLGHDRRSHGHRHLAGVDAGLETILVLLGSGRRRRRRRFRSALEGGALGGGPHRRALDGSGVSAGPRRRAAQGGPNLRRHRRAGGGALLQRREERLGPVEDVTAHRLPSHASHAGLGLLGAALQREGDRFFDSSRSCGFTMNPPEVRRPLPRTRSRRACR